MNAHKEIEVKLRVADAAALRRRLHKLGARADAGGRVHEMNTLFDTPQGGLAKQGQLLRIREIDGGKGGRGSRGGIGGKGGRGGRGPKGAVLTFKGASEKAAGEAGRYKVREEKEVQLADPEGLAEILEALGLRGWFRYEKYRTTYEFAGKEKWARELKVMLDETPIGDFVELEGPREAIDRAAELLGYKRGEYITKSYLKLYLEDCRRRGVEGKDMLFGNGK